MNKKNENVYSSMVFTLKSKKDRKKEKTKRQQK